ncbi:MAG: DNA replication/repair protein RecF [Treponema sp.]|jgi:DNA replication and repair protein RecF|nr:DNA replication/repair protein RecF [Treponema sp.]
MLISSLRFISFRNLQDAEVDTQGRDVFLVGENGQGKTNFLEGVYFCSYASSFRSVNDRELVRKNESVGVADVAGAGDALDSKIDESGEEKKSKVCSAMARFAPVSPATAQTAPLYEKILVKIESSRKTVVVNGKKIEDRKELIAIAPCIVFCHEDMIFASGTPEDRRWFFDQSQSLYDPVYLDDIRNYRKILKTRNSVLKDYGSDASHKTRMLDALDPQLAKYGIHIMKKRAGAAQLFSQTFTPLYTYVSGIGDVEVRYIPSWNVRQSYGVGSGGCGTALDASAGVCDFEYMEEDAIVDLLKKRREGDVSFGATRAGPHRDKYVFTCGGVEFARNASTGQRRLLVLLLRVAEAKRFSDMSGRKPVLLLDDVLLELDPEKRRRFLEVLPEYDQAFYTFLPEEPYQRYRTSDTIVYNVSQGSLSRME